MCCLRRSTDHPRGYALMLAMALAALVLGGSAVILQSAASLKRDTLRKEHTQMAESALISADNVLMRSVFFHEGKFPDELTLGDVKVTLVEQPLPDPHPHFRSVMITARAGAITRQREGRYQRGLGLSVACVGCPQVPAITVRGGLVANTNPTADHVRLLPETPDLCVVRADVAELPPAQCDGRARFRIESEGPLTLRGRAAPPPEDATLPRLADIRARGPVRVEGAITLARAVVHVAAPSLEVAAGGSVMITGGVVMEVPDVVAAPGAGFHIQREDAVVLSVLSPVRPGFTLVPPALSY